MDARAVMPIDPAFVPKLARKARLKHDRHANKVLLLYPERGLELNEEAAAIAQRLDGTRSIAVIVEELACELPVTAGAEGRALRERIERDVVTFVSLLREKGLLEPP